MSLWLVLIVVTSNLYHINLIFKLKNYSFLVESHMTYDNIFVNRDLAGKLTSDYIQI